MRRKLQNWLNTAKIVPIDPSSPDRSQIRKAIGVLQRNGVLVFPTSGLYGLAADAFSVEAVGRVFAIKRRPPNMPVLVMLPGRCDLTRVVRSVPAFAEPLLRLWPGGITLIFEANGSVPDVLTGGTGKIGVRIPAHPVARALVRQFGGPITATSANLSGHPAASRAADLDPRILAEVDLVLDGGVLAGGPGSTVLDASRWPVTIIREGAVARPVIDRVLAQGEPK